MNEQLRDRLLVLETEYEKGQERLREVRMQQGQVQETLLRIEGAITVLQELLGKEAGGPAAPTPATDDRGAAA